MGLKSYLRKQSRIGKQRRKEREEFSKQVEKVRKEKILKDVKSGKLIPRRTIFGLQFETPAEKRNREKARATGKDQSLRNLEKVANFDFGQKQKKKRGDNFQF